METWYKPKFRDRAAAGRVLAEELRVYAGRTDLIVLALPRGGVPVAFEVAKALGAPLDVFLVRKLGVPGQEELAFGAIASGGIRVFNDDLLRVLRLSKETVDRITAREENELERREQLYRNGRLPVEVRGKAVLIVDDGLATGATMRAAVKALKQLGPREIVLAVPVASKHTCDEFKQEADVWSVCAVTPEPFYGVGMWYEDFSQTTDADVQRLLALADAIALTQNGVSTGRSG